MRPIQVRAVYRAATVAGRAPPYDNLTLKIHYPCSYGDSFQERDTGFVPPNPAQAPFPVVILMPGVNISLEAYGWLARRLAKAGFAAVTYQWVTVEIADRISISPGVQIDRLTQDAYGRAPSCPALPALFAELERAQQTGLLAGSLNLDRVLLGGHSAGGSMALMNANRAWLPQVRGAFAYAAHTAGNLQLGWPEGSFMPIAQDLPLLLLGGERDGVIAASSHRYAQEAQDGAEGPIAGTFHEAVGGQRGDRYLFIVRGANHFSFVWPQDKSTGRPYLDRKAKGSGKRVRNYLSDAIACFCRLALKEDPAAGAALQSLAQHPLTAFAERK